MATEICAETKTEAVTLSSPLTSETRRPIIIIIHRRNNRGDRGRLVPPPTFRLGDQQCIGPPQLFGRIVFKKQEISQQVAYCYFSMRLSHSTSITPHSAEILVDIQPATVERLRKCV